jgi:hypothetical protein
MQGSTKQDSPELTGKQFREPPHDFSLVLGGPQFQLLRKLHLSGDTLELLRRRVVAIPLFAWLPLLLLALLGGAARLFFFDDVEVQVRFLVTLPILIAGEYLVHSRLRPLVHRFVERRIVRPDDLPQYDKAIESTIRMRNSAAAEAVLLILVYTFGLWVWHSRVPILHSTWYALPGGRWHLTLAGYWYVFISLPIAQFILLRWYWRIFIWYRFLWRVSRIDLHLISTHPDHCAGLAFVGKSAWAFGPILFAQGAMVAALVASRVLYRGESLKSFEWQIAGLVAFFVFAIFGPLLMFTPRMSRAKRKGLAYYGQLSQEYVEGFERKWVLRGPAPADDLLGSADIQSLADLNNSYEIVSSMRPVPFGLNDIARLVVATAAPFLPLLLTIFSPEELFMRLVRVVF